MRAYLPRLSENQLRWARFLGVLAAAVVLLWIAYLLNYVLTLLAVSFALAYIFNPLVTMVQQRGFSRIAVLSSLYVVGFVVVGFGVAILGSLAEYQVREFITNVPEYVASTQQWILERYPSLGASVATTQPTAAQWAGWLQARAPSASYGAAFVTDALNSVSRWLTAITLVPMFTFFFLLQYEQVLASIRAHLPDAWRGTVIKIAKMIDVRTAEFFRVRLVICFIVGVLSGIGWLFVGVPYSMLFGALAGLLNLVPFMSIALFPIVLISTWAHNPEAWIIPIIGATAVFSIVQAIESFVLFPLLSSQGESALHPVTVIVALMVGGEVGGALGMLLAIPVASTLKALFVEYALPEVQRLAADHASAAEPEGPPPDAADNT